MPLRKLPDSALLNSDQLPLETASTPNRENDDPPPAYGTPLASSQPAGDSQIPQAESQLQPAAAAPDGQGYSANPPMSSCAALADLKPWEIDPITKEHLEKAPGCFCSTRGGCFCSDMGGFCFSSNGGCFFSDNKGCFFSDHAGCCFGDYGGCFCSGPLKE